MMTQVGAIFGAFMTLFYIGVGIYLLVSPNTFNVQPTMKPLWYIIGGTFTFYGLYRAFRAYQKIVEAFFSKNDEE